MRVTNATDAVEHYLSQAPQMRSRFAERLRQTKLQFQRADLLFSLEYPRAIYELTESEIRKRADAAADSLKQAMDAGWLPSEDELRQTFTDCFNPMDYSEDSFSDLKQAVAAFTGELGQPHDTEVQVRFARRIGEVQAQTVKQHIAALKMRLRTILARESASHSTPLPVTQALAIQVNFETGDVGNQILDYLDQHGSVMPSISGIASVLKIPEGVARDEVVFLDTKGLLKIARPQGYSIADGRFDISDNGRALLAARRRENRAKTESKEKAIRLALQLIESGLTISRSQLANSVHIVKAQCAARGIGYSGAMIHAVEKQIVATLRQRSDSAVATIKRCSTQTKAEVSTRDLHAAYDGLLDSLFRDGEALVADAVETLGFTNVPQREKTLEALKVELREKAHAELELFAESLKQGEQRAEVDVHSIPSNKVFVTHGRDRTTRDSVANFLYSIKLEPIVLEDQANAGDTIIEKYEKHAKAGYGIAILSPDDVGCLKEDAPDGLKSRARQNVIFELGYMFASISRHCVAVLMTDSNIERPTNIEGIVWIHLDQGGGWKHKLLKELRAAGLHLNE